jgi:hypothetical protein
MLWLLLPCIGWLYATLSVSADLAGRPVKTFDDSLVILWGNELEFNGVKSNTFKAGGERSEEYFCR